MGSRWTYRLGGRPARLLLPLLASLLPALILFLPEGCAVNEPPSLRQPHSPTIRVRLLQNIDVLSMTAREPPLYRCGSEQGWRVLDVQPHTTAYIRLSAGVWQCGAQTLGTGMLTIEPVHQGSVAVAAGNVRGAYRGLYRLIAAGGPTGGGKFDVINDVDVDGYLAGVLPLELPHGWHEQTYCAQAVVARTYAIYEHQKSAGQEWDVWPDQRSQMYGGIGVESSASRSAVNQTAGVVLAYGPPGHEQIFRAYFSSCCGGITESAADAFGDAYLPPLGAQNNHAVCNASPNFNWGPVVIKKDELTRRMRLWGARRQRPEKNMAPLATLAVQQCNAFGRPVRFLAVDAHGTRYSLSGEELRWAVNTDAKGAGTTLKSSFVKVISDADSIRFVEGHGWGHGVGMCQWCAQRRAESGMRHEDIVLAAFPGATLIRAY